MSGQNKLKLILGLIFILAAFSVVGVLFYMMGDVNLQSQKKISSLQVQLSNLIAEHATTHMDQTTATRLAGNPVTVKDLVDQASSIYTEEEKKQREGFLWIDRDAKTFLVTLGALNGLSVGSRLSVYDGDRKIDSVSVESVFDVVAYVKPVKRTLADYPENYYRVVFEGGT